VSIAYPTLDLIAICLVVLLLSRRTPDRLALCLLGWGITSIAGRGQPVPLPVSTATTARSRTS
jgi:hypothetical protein